MKVETIVGPFDVEVEHVHNITHIKGREKNLKAHKHPVSITLHFMAKSADDQSFLDIHTTRQDLEHKLKDVFEKSVFNQAFEQIAVDSFKEINEWIPEFCNKFSLAQSFSLSALELNVTSHRDKLHHSEGHTLYRVSHDAISSAPI